MTTHGMTVREAHLEDWPLFATLEHRVWAPRGIETVPHEVFQQWVHIHQDGFLIALKDAAMVGYIYCEVIEFSPDALHAPNWQRVVQAGYRHAVHAPGGNSWYGISIASEQPGVGKLLLHTAAQRAGAQGKTHLVAICRMPGLRAFLDAVGCGVRPDTPTAADDNLALSYAIQCVRLVHGSLHPTLQHVDTPQDFPPVRHEDPVLCPFVRCGMALYGTVRVTSFADAASCGYGAILALDLHCMHHHR